MSFLITPALLASSKALWHCLAGSTYWNLFSLIMAFPVGKMSTVDVFGAWPCNHSPAAMSFSFYCLRTALLQRAVFYCWDSPPLPPTPHPPASEWGNSETWLILQCKKPSSLASRWGQFGNVIYAPEHPCESQQGKILLETTKLLISFTLLLLLFPCSFLLGECSKKTQMHPSLFLRLYFMESDLR